MQTATVQQRAKVKRRRGQELRASRSLAVGTEELRSSGALPEVGPGRQTVEILAAPRGIIGQRRICRIAEGPQHSRDILQSGIFCTPFRKRPGGLTFKIENEVVGLN